MLRHTMIILVVLAVWLGIGTVARSETPNAAAPRLKVAATIFPLYDLVRNVAGPAVEVVLLLPPGASPHTFAAKPSTIRALTGSAVIFAIGHTLDDWAVRLAQGAGVSRTIVVDTQLHLRSWGGDAHAHRATEATPHDEGAPHTDEAHHAGHREEDASREREAAHANDRHGNHAIHVHRHGSVDPHYWLAIANARRMVQTIANALGELDPAAKSVYQQRAAAYREQLQAVDHEIQRLLANLSRRQIVTFHSAFGYFAEAYDLHIVTTFEPTPGEEPGPRHIKAFLRQVKAHQLQVLFIEPQLPEAPLYSLARDLGMTLKELDPLGGSKGRDSYIDMMRFNAAQIATTVP